MRGIRAHDLTRYSLKSNPLDLYHKLYEGPTRACMREYTEYLLFMIKKLILNTLGSRKTRDFEKKTYIRNMAKIT